MYHKVLIILRGVSGSGKSTFAEMLGEGKHPHFEADMYHYDEQGNYNWSAANMGKAHKWCQNQVEDRMQRSFEKIIVSNTSTTEKEINVYIDLAYKYGYRVISLVVENRHDNGSIHDVPQEIRDAQEKKLRNSLKLQ